jgi:hypothetical protein
MCGSVFKNSTGLMTKGALKKRWMILSDFKLRYYESPYQLEEVRGEINCGEITSIVEVIPILNTVLIEGRRTLKRTGRLGKLITEKEKIIGL